jgi:hypothetical protein
VPWWSPSSISAVYQDEIPNRWDWWDGERNFRGGEWVRIIEVRTTVTFTGLGLLPMLGIEPITIAFAHAERVIGG